MIYLVHGSGSRVLVNWKCQTKINQVKMGNLVTNLWGQFTLNGRCQAKINQSENWNQAKLRNLLFDLGSWVSLIYQILSLLSTITFILLTNFIVIYKYTHILHFQ